jgi:hypothetical protein
VSWRQYSYQRGREPRAGYVYLWFHAPHLIKIGFSIDPDARLASERSAIRRGVGKYAYFQLDADCVQFVDAIEGTEEDESEIQDGYPGLRVPDSEWFVFDRPEHWAYLTARFPALTERAA